MKRIRLVSPCSARGVELERRDGGAFCPSCGELVHDLRRATRSQALALLDANGGRLCGITRRGADGQPAFAPEPRPAIGALRGAALALALAACDGQSDAAHDPPTPAPTPALAAPARERAVRPGVTPTSADTAATTPATGTPATETAPDPVAGETVVTDTDASPVREHHLAHRHRHPPVVIDDDPLVGGLEGL